MDNGRWIDVTDFNLKPGPKTVIPNLIATFSVKNDTDRELYLMPGICTLDLCQGLIKPRSLSYYESIKRPGPGVSAGGNLGISDGKLGKRERELQANFNLSASELGHIMKQLEERLPEGREIPFSISLQLKLVDLENKDIRDVAYSRTGEIEGHTWYRWVRDWGIYIDWIYLRREVADELRRLKAELNVASEDEVVSELIKRHTGMSMESIFVTGDRLEAKMEEVITDAQKELFIMCVELDMTLCPQIEAAKKRGVNVKILRKELEKRKTPQKVRLEAIEELTHQQVEIKGNPNQHARLIVSEKGALVGSTDPDQNGLRVHKNASVYTTDPTIIGASKLFFLKVWEESEPLELAKG